MNKISSKSSTTISTDNIAQAPILRDGQAIECILTDLRVVIDKIDKNFINAKKLILKLGEALFSIKQYEQSQICRIIKQSLKDKIREGKITEKWIEECLPKNYKRKYTKSELSSLSKSDKNLGKIEVNNFGEATSAGVFSDRKEINNDCSIPSKENVMVPENGSHNLKGSANNNAGSCIRCQELEEALLKVSTATPSILESEAEISFIIPKEKYQEVIGAILCNYNCCYMIFDRFSGLLLRTEVPEMGESDEVRKK